MLEGVSDIKWLALSLTGCVGRTATSRAFSSAAGARTCPLLHGDGGLRPRGQCEQSRRPVAVLGIVVTKSKSEVGSSGSRG